MASSNCKCSPNLTAPGTAGLLELLKDMGFQDHAALDLLEDWPAELRSPPMNPKVIYKANLLDRACFFVLRNAPEGCWDLTEADYWKRDRALNYIGFQKCFIEDILGEEFEYERQRDGLQKTLMDCLKGIHADLMDDRKD